MIPKTLDIVLTMSNGQINPNWWDWGSIRVLNYCKISNKKILEGEWIVEGGTGNWYKGWGGVL